LALARTNLNKTEIAMHARLRTTTNLGRPTARCPVRRLRPKLGLGAGSQNADGARGMWRRRRVKVRRNSLVRLPRSSGSSSDPVASENPCTPPNPYRPAGPQQRGRHSIPAVPLSRQHLLRSFGPPSGTYTTTTTIILRKKTRVGVRVCVTGFTHHSLPTAEHRYSACADHNIRGRRQLNGT